MPEFILDTSGEVPPPPEAKLWPHPLAWSQLDAFTQGYVEALFFTENEPGTTREDRWTTRRTVRKSWEDRAREGQQKDMPGDYGFSDLAPRTLLTILEDCRAFKLQCVHIQPLMGEGEFPDEAQAGRDFWYTRNGHGCGFWDGDWPEPYDDELTKAAKSFRECDVYLGDDGKVYCS